MPCERKHIEAIDSEVQRCVMGLDDEQFYSLRKAVADALAACDESPCMWERIGGDGPYHPSCLGNTPHVSWSVWSRSMMAYCPHCGLKIAHLPAAPEVKP